MKLFAGVEGGASFSKVVLLDETGKIITTLDSEPSTNIWLIGKEEWVDRINAMIGNAFRAASLPPTTLQCLGLCMSGCEDEMQNEGLAHAIRSKYPALCVECKVASDTVGSIMTGSSDGGIVLIAGTGSNSLFFKENGTSVRCGGWGHLIGDYGSAYWIAQQAIRYLIEAEENFSTMFEDTTEARKVVYEHFKITNTMGLLKPLYEKFDKTHFAQLCSRLSKLAIEKKDPLSLKVFEEAGQLLARHLAALLPNAKKEDVSVICVGSVFKSWSLMQDAFLKQIGQSPKRIHIRYLTQSSAIGAAYYAAKCFGTRLAIDFTRNYQELCCYQHGKLISSL